jgi:hypothetical protein
MQVAYSMDLGYINGDMISSLKLPPVQVRLALLVGMGWVA